ncbi:Adaptive-response sensory-kinase SasA [compost metagenome]
MISGLLIILVIVSVLYYKRNAENKINNKLLQKQKLKIAETNEELTTQIEIVAAQNTELEKLNQIKNKFFSIVSHDLRSPMNSLKGLFELFREGNLDKAELNKLTIRIEDTIQSTATFLDNLLEWSKGQLDGIHIKPVPVNMFQLVQKNIQLMDSPIRAKSLKVENQIHSDIQVYADEDMIDIVVRNLLSNAIKFCYPQHTITFSAAHKGNEVTWKIRDSGPGISVQDQQNLFSLSHTTSTGTSGEKGYHIGLILCKDMIGQNQGRISVESEVGKGTIFSVTLPAYTN